LREILALSQITQTIPNHHDYLFSRVANNETDEQDIRLCPFFQTKPDFSHPFSIEPLLLSFHRSHRNAEPMPHDFDLLRIGEASLRLPAFASREAMPKKPSGM
jgi:hypothetical protein